MEERRGEVWRKGAGWIRERTGRRRVAREAGAHVSAAGTKCLCCTQTRLLRRYVRYVEQALQAGGYYVPTLILEVLSDKEADKMILVSMQGLNFFVRYRRSSPANLIEGALKTQSVSV